MAPRKTPRAARGPGGVNGEEGFEANGYHASGLLPQGRRLPVGVPGPHARPRVHPADRRGPLRRRLPRQLAIQRLPRHSRADLRLALRAGVPPGTGRGEPGREARAGRHLPSQAGRGRLQGRHPRPPSEAGREEKRQARGVRGRRASSAWGMSSRPRAKSRTTGTISDGVNGTRGLAWTPSRSPVAGSWTRDAGCSSVANAKAAMVRSDL